MLAIVVNRSVFTWYKAKNEKKWTKCNTEKINAYAKSFLIPDC